jgi:hypothetical protein
MEHRQNDESHIKEKKGTQKKAKKDEGDIKVGMSITDPEYW